MDPAQKARYAAILLTTDKLTDQELASLNLAVTFTGWYDVTRLGCYEKVKHLFTEDGGTRMHSEMIGLLSSIVLDRLGG